MKAQIIVCKETGRRHLYVPAARIQFNAVENGRGEWIVCAFRTDGFHGLNRATAIPTVEHLRQTHHFTSEVDVPQHIVDFAVESERSRQESVESIETGLRELMRSVPTETDFADLMGWIDEDKSDAGQKTENRIGLEIEKILAATGGLQ